MFVLYRFFGCLLWLACYILFQCGLKRNKVNILVNFPVSDLDLGPHLLKGDTSNHGNLTDLYDLYAVCNHYGNMSGGHYTGNLINKM